MVQRRPNRTLGLAHDEFWAWCDKGELRLQRCSFCSTLSWPVTNSCDSCGNSDLEWARMSGRGKVVSWCTFERDYYDNLLPIPWDTILVELEEGPLFVSNPGNFSDKDITFDMEVQLAFLECEDDAGSFRLPIFESESLRRVTPTQHHNGA